MINDINFVWYKWPCTFDCHHIIKFEVIVDNRAKQADWLGVRARTPAYGREMCAEAKHSAERSPWHCCKNKRIANGVYPPRPRSLRFIYDTTEPNQRCFSSCSHLLGRRPCTWSFPQIKANRVPENRYVLPSLSSWHWNSYFSSLSPLFLLSFFLSSFPSFCIIVEEIVNQTK